MRFAQRSRARDLVIGVVAGALAVAIFHQLAILVLNAAGALSNPPYSMRPIPPYGVPAILNQMFWGGVWGIVFALVFDRFPRRWPLVLIGLAFGFLGPQLGSWVLVPLIKGTPTFGGGNPTRMLWGFLLNTVAFGIGLALIFAALRNAVAGRRWSLAR